MPIKKSKLSREQRLFQMYEQLHLTDSRPENIAALEAQGKEVLQAGRLSAVDPKTDAVAVALYIRHHAPPTDAEDIRLLVELLCQVTEAQVILLARTLTIATDCEYRLNGPNKGRPYTERLGHLLAAHPAYKTRMTEIVLWGQQNKAVWEAIRAKWASPLL